MVRLVTGVILLVLAATAAPASAEPVGGELTLVQEDVLTVSASAADLGHALVVWSQRETYGARALGRDAPADGAFEPVPGSFPASGAGQPIAAGANRERGEHLVAWAEAGELRARRLTALGAPLGPTAPITVATLPGDRPAQPDAIFVGFSTTKKEYLVAWSEPGAGATSAIRTRRVGERGELLGPAPVTVSDVPARERNLAPHVAPRPDGWTVVWAGVRADGRSEILVEALEADGSERGSERVISVGESPSLASDPSGGDAIVAWADADGVVAQRLNRSAEPAGDVPRIAFSARAPEVAWSSGASRYLVVWQGSSDRIRGRLLEPDGSPVSDLQEEISADGGREPSVAGLAGSVGFLVAWGGEQRGLARWVSGSAAGSTDTGSLEGYGFEPYPVYDDVTYPYEPDLYPYSPYPVDPYPYEPYPAGRDNRREGDPEATTVGLTLLGTPTLRRLLGGGLLTRFTCPAGCTATVRLTVSAATARRVGVPVTLARTTQRMREAGSDTTELRPRLVVRRRLRALQRLRVTVALAVEPADGSATERRRRSVTLAR